MKNHQVFAYQMTSKRRLPPKHWQAIPDLEQVWTATQQRSAAVEYLFWDLFWLSSIWFNMHRVIKISMNLWCLYIYMCTNYIQYRDRVLYWPWTLYFGTIMYYPLLLYCCRPKCSCGSVHDQWGRKVKFFHCWQPILTRGPRDPLQRTSSHENLFEAHLRCLYRPQITLNSIPTHWSSASNDCSNQLIPMLEGQALSPLAARIRSICTASPATFKRTQIDVGLCSDELMNGAAAQFDKSKTNPGKNSGAAEDSLKFEGKKGLEVWPKQTKLSGRLLALEDSYFATSSTLAGLACTCRPHHSRISPFTCFKRSQKLQTGENYLRLTKWCRISGSPPGKISRAGDQKLSIKTLATYHLDSSDTDSLATS